MLQSGDARMLPVRDKQGYNPLRPMLRGEGPSVGDQVQKVQMCIGPETQFLSQAVGGEFTNRRVRNG